MNAFNNEIGTLQSKLKNGTPANSHSGPPPILSAAEEEMLEEWITHMCKIWYGRTRDQLTLTVKAILDKDGRPNPFTNNRPGKDWVKAFLSRHPKLTLRKSQKLCIARAVSCTPAVFDKWFEDFAEFLDKYKLLDKPSCIYNCDESGFPLSRKVLAPTGLKGVHRTTSGSKQQITTLTTLVWYNATGDVVPPFHIFPRERFKENPLSGAVPNSYMRRSDNGWMTTDLFYGWLANHFVR